MMTAEAQRLYKNSDEAEYRRSECLICQTLEGTVDLKLER